MKRLYVLGMLIAIGAASIGVRAYQQPAQNAPKVIDVDKVKDNLFVLKGGGGNTAVFVTATGVVVVDAKNPGWGQPILDKIKTLTNKPVTMLINTHTHGDHVSGNVEFPATIDVVTQVNTKANMEKMDIFKQNNNRGMAKRTFKDKMTIGKGADQIDLYYFGPGHTNGDAIAVFPALRTAHIGDLFAGKNLPLVDADNGGSVLHYHETLNKVHAGIKNVDTLINGHSNTTTTWADLQTFADFNKDFLTWAQGALKSGKSAKDAAGDWKLPAKYEALGYSGAVAPLFGGVEGRLNRLAAEMKK
ncbi:MAG: MBL fold metallo-hydrolase [Acidobacteriia bacterium]|nr:MBL fold metallo-hydrolase [Terriglobia bacterium]